jgi:hypothetical protein
MLVRVLALFDPVVGIGELAIKTTDVKTKNSFWDKRSISKYNMRMLSYLLVLNLSELHYWRSLILTKDLS